MKREKLLDCIGKTIKTVEIIGAEFGRTYYHYTCIVFEDGDKILLTHDGREPYHPCIDPEEMKKAPNFFSVDDITNRVREIEEKRRRDNADYERRQKEEYEKLKKKFEK